ncbi:hypothetical protein DVT68_18740 [Dyella solisilvae]|uniref:Uncharacterized protein n=1 Tax=Dyella solisilvae TaxID=1920168 RepID=A0A370K376_9GAMM|nr:hypothetical protein [Dyella solisilvae]RDI97116.1 hypothetical protein DVT68_18740 [Dyella solisilvae]
MSTHDHHDDAPPGEDELKALYRSLPHNEPSPALDQAVRRAAADAVRAPARRRLPRWLPTAASAAVLVLVAGLGWRLLEQPGSVPQVPTPPAVTRTQASPTAPANESPSGSKAAAEVQVTHVPETAEATAPVQRPAGTQAPPQTHAPSNAKARARASLSPRIVPPPESAPAPMAMTAPIVAPTPAQASPPPTPMAPAPAMMEAPHPVAGLQVQGYASPRASGAMRAVQAPAPMRPIDPTAVNPTDTPAQELDKIRQLFALQRRDEALQRLATFRQAHPDVPVPDDLRAQLPDHE